MKNYILYVRKYRQRGVLCKTGFDKMNTAMAIFRNREKVLNLVEIENKAEMKRKTY